MICHNCDGRYSKKHGSIHLNDEIIGNYKVPDVDYYVCNKCQDIMYPIDTLKAIERVRDEIEDRLIKKHPLDDFMSASETAKFLGISRQALHKHRRIRRGFIFKTKFAGNDAYLKESVFNFEKTGDGRFPLYSVEIQEKEKEVPVVPETIQLKSFRQPLLMKMREFYKESSLPEADKEYFDVDQKYGSLQICANPS